MKYPNCQSTVIVPIQYGYSAEETWADFKAGRVRIGGCHLHPDNPTHHCMICDHKWQARGRKGEISLPV